MPRIEALAKDITFTHTSTTRYNESMNLIVYKAYFEGLLYRCFHS